MSYLRAFVAAFVIANSAAPDARGQSQDAASAGATPSSGSSPDCTAEPLPAMCPDALTFTIGSLANRSIETNLNGFPVPGDIGPLYIGNTLASADAITLDSGTNFPPGIAFRRNLGTPDEPTAVVAGTQLGYLDFRGYSGTQYWNAGSIDMVVDQAIPWRDGNLMPTQLRFAVSDGNHVHIPIEIRANGAVEIGAKEGGGYYDYSAMGDTKLYVNTAANSWGTIIAARPSTGAGYAFRAHTLGESADDYIIGASSGVGAGTFKFSVRGNGDVHVGGALFVKSIDVEQALLSAQARETAIETDVRVIAETSAAAQQKADQAFELGTETQTRVTAVEVSIQNIAAGALRSFAVANRGDAASAIGENAVALGSGAAAAGADATSIGTASQASGTGALALGSNAEALTPDSMAIGEAAVATGKNSLSIGADTRTNGENSIAVGNAAISAQANAVALGSNSLATAMATTALGPGARAVRDRAVAIGNRSLAEGVSAVAIGDAALAPYNRSVALGANARTTSADQIVLGGAGTSVRIGDIEASTNAQTGTVDAVTIDFNGTLGRQRVATAASVEALGFQTLALSDDLQASEQQLGDFSNRFDLLQTRLDRLETRAPYGLGDASANIAPTENLATSTAKTSSATIVADDTALAIGRDARAEGQSSLAVGTSAVGSMPETTAIGSNSVASAALATTVGSAAQATGDHAVAIGAVSTARGEASTAIGSGSVADHDNSTAIGADARTTAANQIVLGGVGTSVMIGDLAASTAAQIGPVDVVTADTNGTLGRGQAASMSSVEALGAQTRDLVQQLQISDRQLADMSGRLNLLENRLDKMQSDIHGGIAAAMALGGTMVVPDSTVSLNFNLATYRGQQGFSGTVVARVAPRIYLSGGVAGSTASRSKGSRVGVAIGF